MTEADITLRDLRTDPSELEQLLAIESQCFSPADAWSAADFKQWLNTNPYFCVAAEIDGQLVGAIFGRIQRYRLNVGSCAIHPDHRRQGVAAALLAELEKRAKSFSIHQLDLEVRPSNADGLAFWQRMGFEQYKTAPGFYLDGEDALLMHKKI
ncbi:MAG: [ribosomal protein S18]-alanine N-acetyltransferase [Chloroflexota bacterium]|nr:[ribosomal protein S18]-alanine N-acetyltransferase [Chloroflexota bacterium]